MQCNFNSYDTAEYVVIGERTSVLSLGKQRGTGSMNDTFHNISTKTTEAWD